MIWGCKQRRHQVLIAKIFISERAASFHQALLRGLPTCSGGHSLHFSNFTTTQAEASPVLDASFEVWFKKVSSGI